MEHNKTLDIVKSYKKDGYTLPHACMHILIHTHMSKKFMQDKSNFENCQMT